MQNRKIQDKKLQVAQQTEDQNTGAIPRIVNSKKRTAAQMTKDPLATAPSQPSKGSKVAKLSK